MPSMLSYPRRLQSGHITCYLNRTYHVLTTLDQWHHDTLAIRWYTAFLNVEVEHSPSRADDGLCRDGTARFRSSHRRDCAASEGRRSARSHFASSGS